MDRTTELTTSFATSIANLIGLAKVEKGVEVVVRAVSTICSGWLGGRKLIVATDILWIKSNIQWHNVGTLHQSPRSGHLYHSSQHHQHILELHGDRHPRLHNLQRIITTSLVGRRRITRRRKRDYWA